MPGPARFVLATVVALVGSLPLGSSAIAREAGGKPHTTAAKTSAGAARPGGATKAKTKGKKKKRRGSPSTEPDHHHPSLPILSRAIHCPDDMVAVAGRVCVDRFESTLVEDDSHELLSPYYPPTTKLALWSFDKWTAERDAEAEGTLARTMELPPIPEFEKASFRMTAMSWPGSTPSGYVSGESAREACANAGKRLCTESEWVTACRGEKQTQYPYGQRYVQDACNVFREEHPAHVLHGEFSEGLSDPRLNEIEVDGQPLLRKTGETPRCASAWGDDAIFDMVGNLDEWVDDPDGTFLGGFYARATRSGCDARVRAHPINYFDYSTGVRCCKDPE